MARPRRSWWTFAATLGLLAAAAPQAAQAQIMDIAGRSWAPEEGRRLLARISQLERTSGLQAGTIAGIADAVGANYATLTGDRLIELVEQQVADAVRWRERYAALQVQAEALEDGALQRRVERDLAAALQAFDAGRLDEARMVLDRLTAETLAEQELAQDLWLQVVNTNADLATIASDYARASEIRMEAARADRRRSNLRQWQLFFDAATSLRWRGALQGDLGSFVDAALLLEAEALPLVDENTSTQEWARTLVAIGQAWQEAAERGVMGDQRLQTYALARDTLARVIASPLVAEGSPAWLEARIGHAQFVTTQLSSNDAQFDPTLDMGGTLTAALASLDAVVPRAEANGPPILLVGALNTRGNIAKTIARNCLDCDRAGIFRFAIDNYDSALTVDLPPFYMGVSMELLRMIIQSNRLDAVRAVAYLEGGPEAASRVLAVVPDHRALAAAHRAAGNLDFVALETLAISSALYEAALLETDQDRARDWRQQALTELRALEETLGPQTPTFIVNEVRDVIADLLMWLDSPVTGP